MARLTHTRSSSPRSWRSRPRSRALARRGARSWRRSPRSPIWPRPRRPTSCGRGVGWATTSGRSTCGARHGSSSRSTAAACRRTSPPWSDCPGSGRTPRVLSPPSPSGRPSVRSTRTSGGCSTEAIGGAIDAFTARELQRVADAVVPAARPADWTHALMDVGATFCKTTRPLCAACPARASCTYAAAARADSTTQTAAAKRGSGRKPRPAPPFTATSRWLRGRVLDRLREVEDTGWTSFGDTIGVHGNDAVVQVLGTLAREGLLELDPTDPRRARLPIS